ncbi:piggyBac transposable element-derived protein 2-like [Cyprinodon tularosa]|uniref:piggyBac transposable element-derived protein 2-like n=1 Tax=Cyprinodon tularosa TaxID=77115 RepID=UPI0018E274BB|nr:piggyBac transposable element-derived protein 2-like [Cyprinodon tularosa]
MSLFPKCSGLCGGIAYQSLECSLLLPSTEVNSVASCCNYKLMTSESKMAGRQTHSMTSPGIFSQSFYSLRILEIKKYADMQEHLGNSIINLVWKILFHASRKLRLTMCPTQWTSCIADYIFNMSHVVDLSFIITVLLPIKFILSITMLVLKINLGIYGTDTCRKNRLKGVSQKPKSEKLKKEGRGACSVVSTNSNITVTRWLDSSVIHMASTCSGQSPEDTAQRWLKKEQAKISVQRPYSVALYNQHMGGVDLVDQCVAMYPHRRRNKRWYIRVFFHFLDVTVVNAWRLYLMSGLEKMNLLIFKFSVARVLINSGSGQQKGKGRPSGTPPPAKCRAVTKLPREIRFSAGNHWPELTQVKNSNRCHDAACTRKTKYIFM